MGIKMKLLEPFNARPIGAVMECDLEMAASMKKAGVAEETDESVTKNPGGSPPEDTNVTAAEKAKQVQADAESAGDWQEPKKRGRPPKTDE